MYSTLSPLSFPLTLGTYGISFISAIYNCSSLPVNTAPSDFHSYLITLGKLLSKTAVIFLDSNFISSTSTSGGTNPVEDSVTVTFATAFISVPSTVPSTLKVPTFAYLSFDILSHLTGRVPFVSSS